MMPSKLTNAILDERLIGRNIKRLGNYVNSTHKIAFLCLQCQHVWDTRPNSISNGHGCPKCAGLIKLTNEDVDKRIQHRPIKRYGEYIAYRMPLTWQCIDCQHVWSALPRDVISGGNGCPECRPNRPLNNQIIDEQLVDRPIIRLGDYINNHTQISWQCTICDYTWYTNTGCVLNSNSGCPRCGLSTLSNEIIDERIGNRPIKRLDDYVGIGIHISWQCLICEYVWQATSNTVANAGSGCPLCLNKSEKLIHTILTSHQIEFSYQQRLRRLNPTNPNFVIDYHFDSLSLLLEYNGRQHYQPVCFGNISIERAQVKFMKQQLRDQALQAWCDANSQRLIWIDGRIYHGLKLQQYMEDTILPMLLSST